MVLILAAVDHRAKFWVRFIASALRYYHVPHRSETSDLLHGDPTATENKHATQYEWTSMVTCHVDVSNAMENDVAGGADVVDDMLIRALISC